MLRFDPPENATNAEKQPSEGWISCGWQMLDKWREGRGYRELGRLLGCSAGNITLFKQGRVPAKPYLEKLEQMADIPPIAWQWWICVDPSKSEATKDEPPPSSGSRSVEGVKLGSNADELRASVARLTALLGKGKLSPSQVAALEGKRITALCALARLEPMDLHEHPDWPAFMDLIMGGLAKHPGAAKAVLEALRAAQAKTASEPNAA